MLPRISLEIQAVTCKKGVTHKLKVLTTALYTGYSILWIAQKMKYIQAATNPSTLMKDVFGCNKCRKWKIET